MARAIWTGALSFGLVNVPVELFTATEDKTVHFNQFQAGTSDRVRNKRVNERTGDEVEYSQIVKGYELGAGEYVMVEPEELEGVEPGRSRTIEITDFVDLGEIEPIYYRKAYYLAPRGAEALRAYSLLRQVMTDTTKVGIATFVLRGKQHLVAVRPGHEVLVLETMYFADEVRDPVEEIPGLPLDQTFKGRELDTAKLLVDSMSSRWDPANYRDTYRERVEELIAAKRKGEVVVTERAGSDRGKVVDLMEALRASVEAAREHHPGNRDVPPLVERPAVGARSGSAESDTAAKRRRNTATAAGTARGGPSRDSSSKVASSEPTSRGSSSKVASSGRVRPGKASEAPEDLTALSKAELNSLAAQRGVAGRSKMSRRQLEQAVAQASRAAAGRKVS
jgi:DNA end-binding protein Ku